MKISFLDDEPEIFPNQYGGKARTIINLAKEFKKMPEVEEVTILSRSITHKEKEFYLGGIKFKKLNDYSIIRDILDEASKTDILNIHNCSFTTPLLTGLNCKIIYHLHDVIYATSDAGSHLDKALGNNWSQIIAPSSFAANVLKSIAWWSDLRNKISVIPRGINKDIFYNLEKIKALKLLSPSLAKKIAQSYPVIFFPQRSSAGKGEEFLVPLSKLLLKEFKAPLILVPGGIKGKSKIIINTHWVKTNDLKAFYSLSDLSLVLSKLPETFSQSTLESIACETPVIAFRYGNLNGLSKNLPLIYIAEPTLDNVYKQIKIALNDPNHKIKSKKSLKVIDKKYNLQIIAKNLLKIYKSSLKNKELLISKQVKQIHKQEPRLFLSPNVAIYINKAYVVNEKKEILVQLLNNNEQELLKLIKSPSTLDQLYSGFNQKNNFNKNLQSLINKKIIIRV